MHTQRLVSTRLCLLGLAASLLLGCTSLPPEPRGPLRTEQLYVLTQDMVLIRINASQPSRELSRQPLSGLPAGDTLVGIDYRVARGILYGLSRAGRIFTIAPESGQLSQVGAPPVLPQLAGQRFGFNFNPAVDRMRIVSDQGANLRMHPDTGAQIDGNAAQDGVQPDKNLHYADGDSQAGQQPVILAAAYTYNARNDKITTLYTIDALRGTLAMQGSKEGEQPFVSPDGGQLRTVGSLGLPALDVLGMQPGGVGYGALQAASLDISDVKNTAFLAARQKLGASQLYEVNLQTGKASRLGRIAQGQPLVGLAIIP